MSLSWTRLEEILSRLPGLTIGVLGDLFLDRYLEIDAAFTEPSLETGLPAYQVTRVRAQPGAAGTVINNLAALGVGDIRVYSMRGDDGEGYELQQALARLSAVRKDGIHLTSERRTPTYTKPLLHEQNQWPRELNRFDIKNRQPLPAAIEDAILASLEAELPDLNALLVVDQVSEENCGVITERVRKQLERIGRERPELFILADSRERIALFRQISIKPNQCEILKAFAATAEPFLGLTPSASACLEEMISSLAQRNRRDVFCTHGEKGILLALADGQRQHIPALAVTGPIDPVGAGDATSAAIACAKAAGARAEEAAAFGCLVASITIQQIGTTGTATPEQVRQRWLACH